MNNHKKLAVEVFARLEGSEGQYVLKVYFIYSLHCRVVTLFSSQQR